MLGCWDEGYRTQELLLYHSGYGIVKGVWGTLIVERRYPCYIYLPTSLTSTSTFGKGRGKERRLTLIN